MKAYKTYSQCPENERPVGIPLAWPWVMQPYEESQADDLLALGYILASDEDYNDYLADNQNDFDAWLANQPSPIDDVTPRQMRIALVLSGVSISTIETVLNSLPEPDKTIAWIEWEYSIAFKRYNPFCVQVGMALGWTTQQLNNLWILAKTL